MEKQDIVVFESEDGEVRLDVGFDGNTVWLTQAQMASLFMTTKQNVSLHVNNCFKEGELSKRSVVKESFITASDGKRYRTKLFNLNVIISVGYRVKSQRGIEFRRWATDVLRQYIVEGHAENRRRLAQLNQIVQVMGRVPESLEAKDVLSVVKAYTGALTLLDDYDHQRIKKPKGSVATYVLDYDECRNLISSMRFANESDLFGVEKDESFKSSIAAIYQGFGGQELYPSLEEKAANLLYFVVKNHSFHDGNKRIAATLFLYFLNANGALIDDGYKRISDSVLVAVTIMIAESKPSEKEAMVSLVMSFLTMKS